jgi:diaminohydroxyphosphoribosylaminopyrimidine deaminase/5-amino-6-(5-phosphoribosylamino)uracil reductase
MDDRFYMKKVLRLARKGLGKVSPNPLVGALVVKNNEILSEGYHTYFGGSHAEVNALSQLREMDCNGSTLYVNLEPCDHDRKTPPCTKMIIQCQVNRVVIGTLDPNPLVNGKGIRRLRNAGIDVRVGVLEEECQKINEHYFKYITQKKPYITMKIAQTLDGKIATYQGYSRWITSDASRRLVHRMRREHDAILVGVNTIIADDPKLTIRMVRGNNLKRIVLDRSLSIPLESQVLHHNDPHNTIIITMPKVPPEKVQLIQQKGVHVWMINSYNDESVDFPTLWKKLVDEGITSVLVEGGKEVFTSFIRTGEVDRIIIFIAPKFFGQGIDVFGNLNIHNPNEALKLKEIKVFRKGSDIVIEGKL